MENMALFCFAPTMQGHGMWVYSGSSQPQCFCTWKPSSWIIGGHCSSAISGLLPSDLHLRGGSLNSMVSGGPLISPSITFQRFYKDPFPRIIFLCVWYTWNGFCFLHWTLILSTCIKLYHLKAEARYFYILGNYHRAGSHQTDVWLIGWAHNGSRLHITLNVNFTLTLQLFFSSLLPYQANLIPSCTADSSDYILYTYICLVLSPPLCSDGCFCLWCLPSYGFIFTTSGKKRLLNHSP